MPQDDPTLAILDDLADPAKFVRLAAVPVLAPFVRGDETVTAADLPDICRRMKQACDAGDLVTLTHGHIKPAGDERDQPDLLGFYAAPRLGRFGPHGKPAILMDRYAFRDRADLVARLPHRSSEYYPADRRVRGVASLVRPPHVDMGVVALGGDARPIFLSLGASMPDDTAPPVDLPDDDAPLPAADRLRAALMEAMDAVDELYPPDEEAGDPPPAVPLQGNKTPVLLGLDAKLRDAGKKLKASEDGREADHCEAVLLQLRSEGFTLSEPEKVKERVKLRNLPRSDRGERLAELRTLYADRKVPGGAMIPLQSDARPVPAAGGPAGLSRDQYAAALELCQTEGLTAGQARARVLGKK